MILPTKHISTARSLLNLGATLLQRLKRPKTVAGLWDQVRELPEVGTFQRFVLALDFLYMLGAVDLMDGLIIRSQTKPKSPSAMRVARQTQRPLETIAKR